MIALLHESALAGTRHPLTAGAVANQTVPARVIPIVNTTAPAGDPAETTAATSNGPHVQISS